MKKLGLLVMPLMAVSFLTNCGGGGSTPKEDVKFSAQSEVTLDRDNKKAVLSLNWTPTDHSIECSDFTFTLNNQSGIDYEIKTEEVGSRPLKVTIDFAKALEANDKGDLKFKYNDKTAKKEGEGKVTGINIKLHEEPPTPGAFTISMVTSGTDIDKKSIDPLETSYVGEITVTDTTKILDGADKASLLSVTLDNGTNITSDCDYDPNDSYDKATLTIPTNLVNDNVKVEVKLKDKPAEVGKVIWKNWDGNPLETDENVPIGVYPSYDGDTPTQPKDSTYVHRFTGWNPDPTKTPVAKGDNEFTAAYDDVPITDAGAEFKIVIPATNADKTFTFTCNGSKKLTVDWGDTTVDNSDSHTYSKSDTYVVSIYREDITNINVTDSTSKSYIKEIDLKDKITSMADGAFSSCPNLTSVKISKNITSLDANVFSGCSNLSKIVVASGNSKYDSRDACDAIIETATNTLIKGCKGSDIPVTVTAIGDNAFKNCSGLASMGIPDSVTTIGDYAFSGCTSMTVVVFDATNSSLTSIGNYAFSGCSDLKFFSIPDKVTSIGDYAFSDCTSLSFIDIPDSIASVGEKAFDNCPLTYTTENNCKYLEGKSGNKYLLLIKAVDDNITSATINNSCKVICGFAFYGCNKLTTINIPDSVTSISKSAFESSNLSNATISSSSSLTTISDRAFAYCVHLTGINIPNKVVFIENQAFTNCNSLSTVTISNSSLLTTIGDSAFGACGITGINIPNGVTSIGNSAFATCKQLSTVTISNSSLLTTIGDSAFRSCSKLTSINIPDKVTFIGESAFTSCTELSTVTISNSSELTTIGAFAFMSCSKLTSINIPDKVTSVSTQAFSHCEELSMVTISNLSELTSIGDNAFSVCKKLTTIYIPNKITFIGPQAFFNCSILETVDLTAFVVENPNNIPSLGMLAFYGCDALTTLKVANNNMAKIFKEKAGWSEYADKIKTA